MMKSIEEKDGYPIRVDISSMIMEEAPENKPYSYMYIPNKSNLKKMTLQEVFLEWEERLSMFIGSVWMEVQKSDSKKKG